MLGLASLPVAPLTAKSRFRYGCPVFVTRNIFVCDYQICCSYFCSRAWQHLGCASSITRPERIAHRVAFTGADSCVALPPRVANGFAQSKTHSQEREGRKETASG